MSRDRCRAPDDTSASIRPKAGGITLRVVPSDTSIALRDWARRYVAVVIDQGARDGATIPSSGYPNANPESSR
jgi:hypothetical protein